MSDMTVGAEQQQAPQLHDVTVRRKKAYECARVEPVPPEEFGIARNARSIKDAGYCFHEVIRREADLIAEGYDSEQIKKLPSYTVMDGLEVAARDTVDESRAVGGDDGINKANRELKVTEHYVRMDYKGDNKPCLYRVTTAGDGGEILKRDGELDIVKEDMPRFAAMTPIIVTHRFFGKSIADLVMDIQRIKTALIRGALNNLYLHNNPRVEVAENMAGENTLDDLLVSRPGGIVRTKMPGGVTWQVVPDITPSVYPALQYFDATREWRTGVSRQGQGVDPDALQNQVATIANQMEEASHKKLLLIARIFAETGIRDLFSLLHATIRKNGSVAQTVRLRNQWVQVDPREWKNRNDMTINVGLGTGGKAQQLAGAQLLIGAQEKAIPAGLVSKKNLHNSAKLLTKMLGHKDVNEFFTPPDPADPELDKPIPPPPNPDIEKAQMEYQLKEKEAQNRAGIENTQAQADIATNNAKLQNEAAMQERKFQFDTALEEKRFALEKELKMLDAQLNVQKHQADLQHRAADHQMRSEERQDKAQAKPQASIEVKHGADEITGPLSEVVKAFGEHMSKSQEAQNAALMAAIEANKKPKRAKLSNGRTIEFE